MQTALHAVGDTRLAALHAFRFEPLIERFEDKHGMTHEEAVMLHDDVMKWLYLCAVSEEDYSPPERIDFGWHEFILFTEDYADACRRLFGTFIHHRPFTRADRARGLSGPTHQSTCDAVQSLFGNVSGNWQIIAKTDDGSKDCKCNCDKSTGGGRCRSGCKSGGDGSDGCGDGK